MKWFGWFRKNEIEEAKKNPIKRYQETNFFGLRDEITEQEYLNINLERIEQKIKIITEDLETKFTLLINLISKDYLIVPEIHFWSDSPFIKPFNGKLDEDGDNQSIGKKQILNYAKKNKYEYITNIKGIGDLWIKN